MPHLPFSPSFVLKSSRKWLQCCNSDTFRVSETDSKQIKKVYILRIGGEEALDDGGADEAAAADDPDFDRVLLRRWLGEREPRHGAAQVAAAAVREEADTRKIIPPLVVTTAVNLIADMIRDFYPPDDAKRGELVTDIFHQLWHALDLPSDTADDT